jgi:fibronectin-binding autotransporter adhesin
MKTSTTHRLSRLIKHLPSAGLLAAAALLFPAFLPLAGAQKSWTGATDGTWGTANNWDPSGVPGASSPGEALTFGTVASGIYSVDLGGVTRFATGTSALTFSSSNDYTFTNGSLTLANAAGMAMNGSGDAIFNIPVTFGGSGKAISGSGSGALIFNGAVTRGGGTMTITTHVILGGADDNSMGSATLSVSTGGILEVAKSSSSAQGNALGSGEISLINGGVLRISNSSAVFTDNNISVGGGEGSIEANQNASFKNLNANGIRTITFTGPATVTFTGDLTQTTATAGTRNTTLTGAGNAIINGTVNNNSGTSLTSIIKSGAGTVRFNSTTSNYTGSTTINAGVLEVAGLADGGTVSSLGQATNAAANLVFNGGTLRYVGAGNSTDRAFTIDAGGGTLDASGTGALRKTKK